MQLKAGSVQDSERFCRNTLCNGELARYVNDNFICWGGDIRRSEPFKVHPQRSSPYLSSFEISS